MQLQLAKEKDVRIDNFKVLTVLAFIINLEVRNNMFMAAEVSFSFREIDTNTKCIFLFVRNIIFCLAKTAIEELKSPP